MSSVYYKDDLAALLLGDTFEVMGDLESESFDFIFADPPYFLSNGGISCQSGKMVSVNKGKWDEGATAESKHEFNLAWIGACRRLLKPTGTIAVCGTFHNIYSCGMALEELGFKILNNITWRKTNPPPNLSCRYFTHSTETILWARREPKKGHKYNYGLMKELNGGKQMKDVIEGPLTPKREKKFGKHPTQKPEYVVERLLLAATDPGDRVLDPFVGSGTTCAVAKRHNRISVGIDQEAEYLEIAQRRLEDVRGGLLCETSTSG